MTLLQNATPETLTNWMRGRRSIRRYRPEPLPTGSLERLLDVARFAPSAHNRQPWRFAVLRAALEKAHLATAMGERLRADRLADGDDTAEIERDVARSYARIAGAPAAIVACFTLADMDPRSRTRTPS